MTGSSPGTTPSAPVPRALVDVLCVGHASYDLIFSVSHHPAADEKTFADEFLACGGGPAANAAVTVARLGYRAAFAGYLGTDLYGATHLDELRREGVLTGMVIRGEAPTPLSVILVKPDGQRALVNYKGRTRHLTLDELDASRIGATCVLFDGHEPLASPRMAAEARANGTPTVLDAGSLHAGTRELMGQVEYLVCSEKFAAQWLGGDDPERALDRLAAVAPAVVITLGARGAIWRRGAERGAEPAPRITAIDTTGAGDAFHGAFAAGIAAGMEWGAVLRLASAAGGLCCTKLGARLGIPRAEQVAEFLAVGSA